MTFYSPKHVDQADLEKAIKVILDAPAKGTDPKAALRSVVIRKCDHDRKARLDVPEFLSGLSKTLQCLMDEADRLGDSYTDGGYELKDNPDSLSLLRDPAVAAGASGEGSPLSPPLDALPPAVRGHLVRRHDRVKGEDRRALQRLCEEGNGLLAAALVAENADINAIASENAEAASKSLVVDEIIRITRESGSVPLVRLGQGECRREIGGE